MPSKSGSRKPVVKMSKRMLSYSPASIARLFL